LTEDNIVETRPVVKLWFETDEGYVFGEGTFELLDRIEQLGTIAEAASSMKMSYRQAWGILKKVERRLGELLVETSRGGAHGGGGARLTPLGKRLLRQYRIEKEIVETDKEDLWRWEDLSRKLSARNKLDAEVISVETGEVASVVKVRVSAPTFMTAVITKEAAEELELREGVRVQAVVKATSVMIGRVQD